MDYNTLASSESVEKTTKSLTDKGYKVYNVLNKIEALEKIKEIIPEGVSIMNGSSKTLDQIGYLDLLKSGNHKWNNLHTAILAETDKFKQSKLRKEATLSDYYLGSVHAITEDGDLIIASNTGSQLPHIVFSSNHLVFVISTKKITKDLMSGVERLEKHIKPLEDERMKGLYGVPTTINKILIFKGESPMMGRTVDIILVNEDLGF